MIPLPENTLEVIELLVSCKMKKCKPHKNVSEEYFQPGHLVVATGAYKGMSVVLFENGTLEFTAEDLSITTVTLEIS